MISDLVPAQLDVELNGLEASVTVIDKCQIRSRRADSYSVHYCLLNAAEECSDKCKEQHFTNFETKSFLIVDHN